MQQNNETQAKEIINSSKEIVDNIDHTIANDLMSISKNDAHTFIIPYSDLNLEVYNEEYFKRLGIHAEIRVVVKGQTGGGHSYDSILEMEKKDNLITVPYKFFHYRLKFLFGDVFTGFDAGKTVENTFEKTMNNVSVYGKHIIDSLSKKAKTVKMPSITIPKTETNQAQEENQEQYHNDNINIENIESEIQPQEKESSEQPIQEEPSVKSKPGFVKKMQKWLADAFKITDDPSKNEGNIDIDTNDTSHIKIILYGTKNIPDPTNYADVIQYVKIIHNLHIKQITIKELETVKIDDNICIIGNIVKEIESLMDVFKRGVFKDFPLKRIENTEAHKLLLF
jgi:hypothetical protein